MASLIILLPKKHDPYHIIVIDKAPFYVNGRYHGDVAWGPLRKFPIGEFRRKCLEIVRLSLREYASRDASQKGEFDLLSKEAELNLRRRHFDLLVSDRPDGALWISMIRRSDILKVGPSASSEESLSKLAKFAHNS